MINMDSHFIILSIGFLAQLFFSARILVQWVLSERAKQVVSPSIFWILSLAGSFLLCLYGWLRDDFSIILGQFITYYIYLWNLKENGIWKKIPGIVKGIFLLTPMVVTVFMSLNLTQFIDNFFRNEQIPLWLLIFGSIGQVIFTLRFVYQWIYSYHHKESVLPTGFWIISLIGASIIVIYGILRLDIVLILGQSFGLIAYIRNLYIEYHYSKSVAHEN